MEVNRATDLNGGTKQIKMRQIATSIKMEVLMSHPDLRDKAGCVSYVRQRRTPHIITECIEINVTIS